MSGCCCDWESPEFYSKTMRAARKAHQCDECRHIISAGESYEYVSAKSDGRIWTARTCLRCLALRDYVVDLFPCFCMEHGSLLDDADEMVREFRSELPGMGLAYGRLRVAVHRGRPA